MQRRSVTFEEVQVAIWTRREAHPPHEMRAGSYWAPVLGRRNLWVLYRPLDGDDLVITVTPRSRRRQ